MSMMNKYGILSQGKKMQAMYFDGTAKWYEAEFYAGIQKIVADIIPISYAGDLIKCTETSAFIADELYQMISRWSYHYIKLMDTTNASSNPADPSSIYLGKRNRFVIDCAYSGNHDTNRISVGESGSEAQIMIADCNKNMGRNYRNYNTEILNGFVGYILSMDLYTFKNWDSAGYVYQLKYSYDFTQEGVDVSKIVNGQLVNIKAIERGQSL